MAYHNTPIKVHGFHLDLYQHVNNARYLEFLEAGRWEWMAASGDMAWFQAQGLAFVVVNININFRASATLGQQLRVQTGLARLGDKSGVISQRIVLDDDSSTLICDAEVTFVCLDQRSGKVQPMAGELLKHMAKQLEQD